jgi:hypothetical protein
MGTMKFVWSVVVYLLLGVLLAWGILQAMKGSFLMLAVVGIGYVVALGKIGCLPKQSH